MEPAPQPDPSSGEPAVAEPPEPRQEWLEDLDELPPRPRRRLLAPGPLALLGVLLVACGFIAGVLVEKGQNGSSAASPAASAFASRLRGLAGAGGTGRTAAGTGSAGAAGVLGGASGAGRPTSGTVSYSANGTLYVTDGESNTIKVKTSAATTVTKTVNSSVKAIRPGETVTVTGAQAADGTVTAEAIRVGGGSGLAALFGGSGASGSGGSAAGGSGSATGSGGPALFGSG